MVRLVRVQTALHSMLNNGDLMKLHKVERLGVTRNARVGVVRNSKNVTEPNNLRIAAKVPVLVILITF